MSERERRPSVLVVSYSPLVMDARVLRQARELSRYANVTTAGFGQAPIEGVDHVELEDLAPYTGGMLARVRYALGFILGRFRTITDRNLRDADAERRLAGRRWDLVMANDVTALALAARLPSAYGFIADLHEFSPRQAEESLKFRLTESRYFAWLLRTYLPRASAVLTVSEGIGDAYRRTFGVECTIVTNAAGYVDSSPSDVGEVLRVVHSAAPSPARRIEVMIDAAVATSTPMTLDLYLVDDGGEYIRQLSERASRTERVTIRPAVPQSELVEVLSRYDIGVHVLPPINFNHTWALPNKLFDYIQARLGLVIGPSPEMQRIVEDFEVGAVAEDFSVEALTRTFDSLDTATVWSWKRASHAAARVLSAENQMARLSEVVQGVLAGEKK